MQLLRWCREPNPHCPLCYSYSRNWSYFQLCSSFSFSVLWWRCTAKLWEVNKRETSQPKSGRNLESSDGFRKSWQESASFLISFPSRRRRQRACKCALLTDADSMWGVEDEPQPAHAAIAPPGVHTDAVLTQPRLQALIHVYTHTQTLQAFLSCQSDQTSNVL